MARKYINLFDEQGNPVRVPLGADAENVDLATIAGLNSTNAQAAFAELLGKISQSQGQGAEGGAGFIDNATIGNLNDIDVIDVKLTGPQFTWEANKKMVDNNGALNEVTAEGYTFSSVGYIKLLAGDVLVTNADSDDALLFASSAKLIDGKDAFDGEYIVYKALADVNVKLSYKSDVDYDVHVFVVRQGIVSVPITVYAGKLTGGGQAQVGSTTTISVSGYNYVITDYINVTNAEGKFLFIPEGFVDSGFVYTKYKAMPSNPLSETSSDVAYAYTAGTLHNADFPYLVIPITSAEEIYRIAFKYAYASTARVYLVTLDWMKRHGYADQWAGKKWLMYGDSTVKGHSLGYAWHSLFAKEHFTEYINKGENGIGLVLSPNLNYSLISKLEERLLDSGQPLDVDVIGVVCGRNDYSCSVPIGTIDDMLEMIDGKTSWTSLSDYGGQVTFMGALNYLCKWLIDHYPTKRIFFNTPWYFPSTNANEAGTSADYVDAMLAVTGKWGIPCFDCARRSGIAVQNETFRSTYFLSSSDISHLNASGHLRMAHGPICKWLENLFSE